MPTTTAGDRDSNINGHLVGSVGYRTSKVQSPSGHQNTRVSYGQVMLVPGY